MNQLKVTFLGKGSLFVRREYRTEEGDLLAVEYEKGEPAFGGRHPLIVFLASMFI